MTTSNPRYAVVWVDHKEARVLFLHREDPSFEERVIHAHLGKVDERHASGRRHHSPAEEQYFEDVSRAMTEATESWVVGPAATRADLIHYLEKHHRDVRSRVKGVDKVDHPTNGELAELGRRFFEKLVAPRQIFVRS